MDADLESKLRELIDRQEIWSVLLRYSRGLDRLDRQVIRSCYHDDAIDDHHVFVGKVEDFIDWAFGYSLQCNIVHHHGIGNHYCELDGDNAYSETYYTFIGANLQPPHLLSMGRYIDHFQRRDGVWRIANRVCVIEKHFDLLENHANSVEGQDPRLGPLRPATRDRNDLSYHRPVVPRRPPVGGSP
jgi:SnoaL-like domain